MDRPKAEPVVHVDDGRFRVTEWRFAPGAETGWHVHGHDYVVVPIADGTLGLEEPGGGRRQAALVHGRPYARRRGVHHNVVNDGAAPVAFIEVEALEEAEAEARRATLVRFMAAWNARDLGALMDCMAEDCAFHASAGPEAEGARHIGRAAVEAAYAAILEAFPEAAWTADRHHVAGDTGLSEWRFVGTDRSGRRVEVQGCDIFRFTGDRIALKDSYRKARSG